MGIERGQGEGKDQIGARSGGLEVPRDRTARPVEEWDARKEEALLEMVLHGQSQRAAAQRIGVSVRTLHLWEKTDAWKERRTQVLNELQKAILREGIANQTERIHQRNLRYQKLRSVLADRGNHYRDRAASGETIEPGAETGMLIRVPTAAGDRWTIDKPTLDALEVMEKDTALELGQIAASANGKGGGATGGITITLETGDAIPSYVLGTAVDALETAFTLMANGLMPELPEDCERMAFTLARRMCGWRDDEPWDWDPEILKAIKSAAWSLPRGGA